MQRAPQEIRTYFVTTVTAQRRSLFNVTRTVELLVQFLQLQREKKRMAIHAYVVMPDHLHLLLTPAADVSLETAMQFIKGGFSFQLKSKMDVWERSFNEVQIVSPERYAACVRYIEENPVRKGLVRAAGEFPYSSAYPGIEVDPAPTHLEMDRPAAKADL